METFRPARIQTRQAHRRKPGPNVLINLRQTFQSICSNLYLYLHYITLFTLYLHYKIIAFCND